MAHLGIGAFHRAHQAVYTEDAMAAAGEPNWGIVGVTQRSPAVRDQLIHQDCLYTVLERGGPGAPAVPPRVVGAVCDVLWANDPAGPPAAVAALIADPRIRIVTLTVTEKGYRRAPGGGLDLSDEAVRADLARAGEAGAGPRTVIGQLVAGLARRAQRHGLGLTVLCCDNLPAGGEVLRGLVADFVAALPTGRRGGRRVGSGGFGDPAELAEWIKAAVSFPSSMVDRIVPATTPADRAEVTTLLGGVIDEAAVVAERFTQWVIEESFAAGRPAWEAAGALFTADVAPYEAMKLRLLNGTHSLLAYTGALAGHETIAEAVRDPALADLAAAMMRADLAPTLAVPAGIDLAAYQASVLERFANPALRHRTVQVAADGSQKLPIRLLGAAADRLAAGAEPSLIALAVAAWMLYVARGRDRAGRPLPLDDPLAAELTAALGPLADAPPATLVDAALGVRAVFPEPLAADATFRACLIEGVGRVRADLRLTD
ncbi:MAG: mannitol dehydrogenase family protein [Frankia sp.]|nr:mannitol dehydrogenase family protein [Frankia sp.]